MEIEKIFRKDGIGVVYPLSAAYKGSDMVIVGRAFSKNGKFCDGIKQGGLLGIFHR